MNLCVGLGNQVKSGIFVRCHPLTGALFSIDDDLNKAQISVTSFLVMKP